VFKVERTNADLAAVEEMAVAHIAEALQYRSQATADHPT
jgi:predicted ATPase with chaperone activity